MPQNRVEDLLVYQKAVAALESVVALTDGPTFDRDPKLRQQIRTASGRITTHLQEGSGQATDRHYAHYVAIARGSSKETKGHFHRALACGFITDAEFKQHWQLFDEIAALLTGLKR